MERFLVRGPFSLAAPAAEVAASLWSLTFAAARSGKEIDSATLLDRLRQAGLQISSESWALYPTAERYYPHSISTDFVSSALYSGEILLITGIGGTGKTTLVAESATIAASEGRRSCWISLNELLEPSDTVELIADYCRAMEFRDLSAKLRQCRPYEYPTTLAQALADWPISIVFDRFEAAGPRLGSLVKDVIQHLPRKSLAGTVILSSRYTPGWWPDVEREKNTAKSISLGGLPSDSAERLLREVGVGRDDNERSELFHAVCGHPQSLLVMQQVSCTVAPEQLKEVGVVEARDWLLRRVLDELSPEFKSGLARLSVFDYSASRSEALAVIGKMGPDILRGLVYRDLVCMQGGTVTVHDALREVAVILLTLVEIAEVHWAAADHLLREFQKSSEETGNLYYDTGIKWAAHLEAASKAGLSNPEFEAVVKADVQLLRDLFAISTVGFPHEFEDPTLAHTWSRVQSLIDQGLVKRVDPEKGEDPSRLRALAVAGLGRYQSFLADCRCLLHGYSNHVGYVDDLRPNHSFEIQGLGCPWEHCIELQPVPPMDDEVYAEWIDSLRDRLCQAGNAPDTGSYCEYLIECLADASSSDVVADRGEGNSCPIFGHCCPGGRAQARVCQSMEHDDEVDATNDWGR
ncbi:MAG: hypothetical protein HY881_22540 [Deltaproteobacteria bacterium]|nr:hypothetical protein [Deltaproteobacteria bacterium]